MMSRRGSDPFRVRHRQCERSHWYRLTRGDGHSGTPHAHSNGTRITAADSDYKGDANGGVRIHFHALTLLFIIGWRARDG